MDPQAWETLRFSCPGGVCGPPPHWYFPALLQCADGGSYFVGMRRKNGAAEPSEADPQKVALKINIDEYVAGQRFAGKKKLSLENGAEDALVTEGLSWQLYQASGIAASRAAWVNVHVNDAYKGLYVNVEQVDKTFLTDHGIDNGGFLFKIEDQRTRRAETDPFAFNWYPFDHPTLPAEITTPSDWRIRATALVNIPDLLTSAAIENFMVNTDGTVGEMHNYWYYDWSTLPLDHPAGRQPRLYFPWDLDTVMNSENSDYPVLGTGGGHLRTGLLEEVDESGVPYSRPAFQDDYVDIYRTLLDDPIALAQTLSLVDTVESVIAAHISADPYQQIGSAAAEFHRVREFLQARTAWVVQELSSGTTGDFDEDGDRDLHDHAALTLCYTDDAPAECATGLCRDAFDFDGDCDVDLSDLGMFVSRLNGPSSMSRDR